MFLYIYSSWFCIKFECKTIFNWKLRNILSYFNIKYFCPHHLYKLVTATIITCIILDISYIPYTPSWNSKAARLIILSLIKEAVSVAWVTPFSFLFFNLWNTNHIYLFYLRKSEFFSKNSFQKYKKGRTDKSFTELHVILT